MEQHAGGPCEVFLSYAREELIFVRTLAASLEAVGLKVWVDVNGVYGGEEFWPQICQAIDAAAVVVFVISPHSAASPFCRREIERAVDGRKRIIPACRHEVDAALLPPVVADRQWLFFRTDEEAAATSDALVRAVRVDWAWVREHARFLTRAREWHAAGKDTSLTLRGRELRSADRWLSSAPGEPEPAPLHLAYIQASHGAARRRRLRLGGMAAAALAAIASIGWWAANNRISTLYLAALADVNGSKTESALSLLADAERLCGWTPFDGGRCENVANVLERALLDAGRYEDAVGRLTTSIDATAIGSESDRDAQERLAIALRNRAYARIMLAETRSNPADRERDYGLALEDVESAGPLEVRALGAAKLADSALTTARVHVGRGAYDDALRELDRAARFNRRSEIRHLLSAIAFHCLGRGADALDALNRYQDAIPDGQNNPDWPLNWDYFEKVTARCTTTPH